MPLLFYFCKRDCLSTEINMNKFNVLCDKNDRFYRSADKTIECVDQQIKLRIRVSQICVFLFKAEKYSDNAMIIEIFSVIREMSSDYKLSARKLQSYFLWHKLLCSNQINNKICQVINATKCVKRFFYFNDEMYFDWYLIAIYISNFITYLNCIKTPY